MTIIWPRAHQNRASGVVNAAEWFDVEDAHKTLFQMEQKSIVLVYRKEG
jgi:hypothetical protein